MSVTVTQNGISVPPVVAECGLIIDVPIADETVWHNDMIVITGMDGTDYTLVLDDTGTKYSGQAHSMPNTFYVNVEPVSSNCVYPVTAGTQTIQLFGLEIQQAFQVILSLNPGFQTKLKSVSSGMASLTFERTVGGVAGNGGNNSVSLAPSFLSIDAWVNGADEQIGSVTRNIENTHKIQGSVIGALEAPGSATPSAGDVIYRVKAIGMDLGEHLDFTYVPLKGTAPSAPIHLEMGDVLDGPFTSITIANGTGTNGSSAPKLVYWERT
tara:strand:+ start:31175 stop:31978 length:804 start_codon:yes stop_codon:yes gene_type:complete